MPLITGEVVTGEVEIDISWEDLDYDGFDAWERLPWHESTAWEEIFQQQRDELIDAFNQLGANYLSDFVTGLNEQSQLRILDALQNNNKQQTTTNNNNKQQQRKVQL